MFLADSKYTDIILSVIGNKWKILIIRELLSGTKRFSELKSAVTGISQKVLTLHLRGLEDYGILTRQVYKEVPPRVEYTLSEAGRGLSIVIAAMDTWGETYLFDNNSFNELSKTAIPNSSEQPHPTKVIKERESSMSNIETSLAGNISFETIETHLKNPDGLDIFGILYKPAAEGKLPLIIISPEFGNTYQEQIEYGKLFASHGIAVYTFDFCGGSSRGSSEGEFKKMSVVTNKNDLSAVIQQVKEWPFIDTAKIVAMGLSQGGFATTLVASERIDELAGIILCYPAYVIVDDCHTMYERIEDVPDEVDYRGWCIVGGCYIRDPWYIDPYAELTKITKPLLYLHGTADADVPVSYAEKAGTISDVVNLHIIDGAPHNFVNEYFDEAAGHMLDYLKQIKII